MTINRLFAGTSALALVIAASAVPAYAQTAPATPPADDPIVTDDAQAEAESADGSEDTDIIVTGSRIPKPQYEGLIPGAQVTEQEIKTRGFNSVIEALNDIPLVGPGASPIGNAGGQPSSLGAAFVDLLDLGTARTLSLVNGRRFVPGNAGTLFVAGNVTGSQVDLNVIPTELVQRTDVLTVGGAVAYGADGIAGVVNMILRDDYEGQSISLRSGISSRGDSFTGQVGVVIGRNFMDDRGNIAASFQYNRDDGLTGDARDFYFPNYLAPTNFANGALRNPGFVPSTTLSAANNNLAFLQAATDGIPGTELLPLIVGGSSSVTIPGSVFQYNGAIGTFSAATTLSPAGSNTGGYGADILNSTAFIGSLQAGAQGAITLANTTQVIPGTPISSVTATGLSGNIPAIGNPATAPAFSRFAPSTLPAGVSASAVVTAFAPTFNQATATTAQLNTLALQLLQANRPTLREFLAANPTAEPEAFLGSLVPIYLDVANTDPLTAQALPRRAVLLQFDTDGNLQELDLAQIAANEPRTVNGVRGANVREDARAYDILRVQQDRYIGNLLGHFDFTDWLTFYTENLYAKVDNVGLRNAASFNGISSGGTENAALIASISNPFLTDQARASLIAAGVPATGGRFVLSRVNQDITGDNPSFTSSDTYRTVNGLRGKFDVFGRNLRYDVAASYARQDATITSRNIGDVEYALAIDAVRDANNNIICRSQLPGASTALPAGVTDIALVRLPGPDGVLVEQVVKRTVTPEQIAGCRPLNIFGFNTASEEAKAYVTKDIVSENENIQKYVQATLATGNLFDLPGGGLGVALNAEYREESVDFVPVGGARFGISRFAAYAQTTGETKTTEASIEASIPLFGEGFNLPFLRELTITPGVRWVKQDGDSPDVKRLNGQLDLNESKGEWNRLYTIGGTAEAFRGLRFRGNLTKSLRQPSVVELFLGNQPAFNTPTDPCTTANIGGGNVPTIRRANCEAEVIRLGIAANQAAAATFLSSYVSPGTALQGGFSGSPGLKPENGTSWTIGGVFQPVFVPGLSLSADYIDVLVEDVIIPTNLSNALQFCYDSPTFNDTSAQLGVNTCNFYSREPLTGQSNAQFYLQNGFASGFINLGALKVHSLNMALDYNFRPSSLISAFGDTKVNLNVNAYRLFDYFTSSNGTFDDTQDSSGTFFQPDWKVRGSVRVETGKIYGQWTTSWQNKTKLFSAALGAPITIEQQDVLGFNAFATHDATLGINLSDRFSLQGVVRNVFDKNYAGLNGLGNAGSVVNVAGQVDLIGRRYQMTARAKF